MNHGDTFKSFLSHLQAGRKEVANELLKQLLAESPDKAGPYALLIGGMLAQNGQYREAVPLYQEAIAANPEDPAAYFYLGVAYHGLQDEQECNRIWDQLASRFPDHATTHYQQALRSLKLDQYVAAKHSLQNAILRFESDHPLRSNAQETLKLIDRKLTQQS